jgi:hypothetical protein
MSLIKSEAFTKEILSAMHLSADVPKLRPARSPRMSRKRDASFASNSTHSCPESRREKCARDDARAVSPH